MAIHLGYGGDGVQSPAYAELERRSRPTVPLVPLSSLRPSRWTRFSAWLARLLEIDTTPY